MTDLKFQHISRWQYMNITHMSVTDFELLLQHFTFSLSSRNHFLIRPTHCCKVGARTSTNLPQILLNCNWQTPLCLKKNDRRWFMKSCCTNHLSKVCRLVQISISCSSSNSILQAQSANVSQPYEEECVKTWMQLDEQLFYRYL